MDIERDKILLIVEVSVVVSFLLFMHATPILFIIGMILCYNRNSIVYAICI